MFKYKLIIFYFMILILFQIVCFKNKQLVYLICNKTILKRIYVDKLSSFIHKK